MIFKKTNKKERKYSKPFGVFMAVLMFASIFVQPDEVYAVAGYMKEETSEYLPLGNAGGDTAIGRYQFNYIGNWNYLSKIDGATQIETNVQKQTVISGFANSSVATLSNSSGAKGIVKAYLIWNTSKPYDAGDYNSNHVRFIMRDGVWKDIYPDYAYCDNRTFVNWPGVRRASFCMFADVTSIVKAYGYGDYYVANMPVYHPTPGSGGTGGGMNVASWQLVVVEEGDNFPVRALTLKAGATFRFGDWDYDGYNGGYVYPNGNVYNYDNYKKVDTYMTFNNGIHTKSTGNVSGQILVGCIDDPGNPALLTGLLYTRQTPGGAKTAVTAASYANTGLYRNGSMIANDKCDSVHLIDVSGGLGNNAAVVGMELDNIFWNTQFYMGTAIDIAYPDFEGTQTTTVNDDGGVTVTGRFKNIAASADTGIYNGHLEVIIDTGLAPVSATAVVNDGTYITGSISGNTVTFSGAAVASMMNGSTISYTVQCADRGTGATVYKNNAGFHGYLRSDGVNTGYWIDRMWTAESQTAAKYRVTVVAGTGIERVTGSGMYTYGTSVTAKADVKDGYHWKDWTGDLNTAEKDFSFAMPAHSVTIRANAEANTYTIHFDPNDGTEVTPIPDMTVRFDEEITLPDATDAYMKYTLDGVNVTQNILDGTIVLDENGVVMMMLDEETGAMMTPDGATVSADGIITKTNEDGSMTMTYPDGSVTIIYPDGNAVTVSPEGIRTEINADGSKKVIYPDGNVVRINPDGTIVPSEGAVSGTTGVTGADESTDGTRTGTAGDSIESTEGTEHTENTEATGSTESTETVKDTEKTASVERNAVSMVATAADGVDNGTDTGTNAADMTSAQADLADDLDAEPKPNKKAYASVFMGWSLEEEKDTFVPQWKAGEPLKVSDLVNLAGMTDTNGATITLYAAWDDCPWIVAENLYYTLVQAQSGFITQDEILSHATAYDREDGSPIAPGVHENGTSFTIPDYSPTDFTQFQHEGSCTENLTVVDSVGNTYWKQITVYIVDTTPVAVKPEGTTRFINEYYYNQPYENGGLEDNSIWKTDPEYAAVLQQAFDNLKNDTPEETYYFTHEEILEMKQFIDDNGFGNTQSEDALNRFYNQFMAPNKVE